MRTLLGEVTVSHLARKNFALGGNFLVNVEKQNLEKYDFGLSWSPAANAFLGLKHESANKSKLELGKFFLYVHHAASSAQTVGTEFTLNW